MTIADGRDSFEPGDYLGMLRRRWWIVLGLACVGVLVAGGYYKASPKAYTATAAVYVNASAANNNQTVGRTGGPVNMDNEAQIVQSQTVAALAARELHSALPPQTLVKQIGISVPANTTVLDISCKARPRAAAAACANDFASAYLSVRLSEAAGTVSSAVSALQSKADGLANEISRLKIEVTALPANSARRTTTEIQLNAANSQLAQVQSQIDQLVPELSSLQAPANTLAGHVITPAIPPASASSPRALLLLPSGLLAGLLIGLVAAFVVERRDDRIHAARDVERFSGLPVLLSISAEDARARGGLARLRPRADREFAELARHLAASLGDGSYILAVAGTSGGSGGSVVAANLAVMLARAGADVALVCADRGTAAPQLLGVGGEADRGLSELLAGTVSPADVGCRPPGTTRLRVVTAGAGPALALSAVERNVIRGAVADLRLYSRFVIIETDALGDAAETFTLAEFADAAIVAVEQSATRRSDLEDCLLRLDRLGTSVLGAAVIPAAGGAARDRLRPRADPPAPSAISRPALQPAAGPTAGLDLEPRSLPWVTETPDAASDDAGPAEGGAQSDPYKDPADSAAGA